MNKLPQPNPMDEEVLVIRTAIFHAAGCFQGFRDQADHYASLLLKPEHFQFLPRSRVESDPSFKQLIPYVVLRHGSDVFSYRRGRSGGEQRLHAKRSIGVGGHIGKGDFSDGDLSYRRGMLRELTEEIDLRCGYLERFLGIINDDSTPVGQVHLGIVHVFDLEGRDVAPRESALRDGRLEPLAELQAHRNEFETWSQFVLDALS